MSQAPFFSVIITTCRDAYPLKHMRDKHILEQMIENCKRQTFKDFELIIVDLMWTYRRNWIKQTYGDLDFPVLHIIDKDSPFRDYKLIRICTARNTGLLYARGQCVIFTDDGQEWTENSLERLHSWGSRGHGATCRIHRDNGKGPIEIDSRWMSYGLEGKNRARVVSAEHIGHLGGSLSMVPIDRMLQCNGWDEMFDGARQLEDSDMCKRLGATGLRMAFEGHPKVVEYALDSCSGHILRRKRKVKCNGSYFYPIFRETPHRIRANNRVLTDEEISTFVGGECLELDEQGHCSMPPCDPCLIEWDRPQLLSIYKDPRLVFDLEEMRAERSWETASDDPLIKSPKELLK
jgi:hypothetical protein